MIVARELYAAILDRIEAQRYDVFAGRKSRVGKLLFAARCAASDPGEIADRIRYRRTAPTR